MTTMYKPLTSRPNPNHLRRSLRHARAQLLTPRQQQMMTLYYDKGMTMPQIAQQLDINTSTVSRTISRAKVRLHHHLQFGYVPEWDD